MTTPLIRVLLVDDHPPMRKTLARVIRSFGDMEVVAEVNDGLAAVAAYLRHKPDVTLMDISIPQLDGLLATRLIRQTFPQARVILMGTMDEARRWAKEATEAGAVAVLGKDSPITQLADTIRKAHNGGGL